MRIAIFSDIHGNMEAFRQVLIDIDRSRIDKMFCLGDNIGYGPEPEHVLNLIRDAVIPSVLGNHDLGAIDPSSLNWFNNLAAESLKKTIRMLSPASLNFLSGLKTSIVYRDCLFVHGFPPDSPTTYLFQINGKKLVDAMAQMEQRLCFIGHTHELKIIQFDGKKTRPNILTRGAITLKKHCKYIINIGSVGQPRDGDNRAKYVIYDTEADEIEVRYIAYDIDAVVKKITEAGLPEVHATRLF